MTAWMACSSKHGSAPAVRQQRSATAASSRQRTRRCCIIASTQRPSGVARLPGRRSTLPGVFAVPSLETDTCAGPAGLNWENRCVRCTVKLDPAGWKRVQGPSPLAGQVRPRPACVMPRQTEDLHCCPHKLPLLLLLLLLL